MREIFKTVDEPVLLENTPYESSRSHKFQLAKIHLSANLLEELNKQNVTKITGDQFGNPTFRLGTVFRLNDISLEQINDIRYLFSRKWDIIKKSLIDNPTKFHFSEISSTEPQDYFNIQEGFRIVYPKLRGKFSSNVEINLASTLCVPALGSKNWIRLSSINNEFKDVQSLNLFLDKAGIASEEISNFLLKLYEETLEENSIYGRCLPLHQIIIETWDTDLGDLLGVLRSGSVEPVHLNDKQFKIISPLLDRAFRGEVIESNNIMEFPNAYDWITMRIPASSNAAPLTGLYLKRHIGAKKTIFVGVVHVPSGDKANISYANEFSKRLVQVIGPAI
jgi:hypothetical protein